MTVPNGANDALWRTPLHSRASFAAQTAEEKLRYLASAGHAAPSSHNTQPWRFMIHPTAFGIDVFINQGAILPASDVKGRQAVISVGCAIENIKTAAAYFGYRMHIICAAQKPDAFRPQRTPITENRLLPLSTLAFHEEPSITGDEGVFAGLWSRKVIRAEFDLTRAIPNETPTELVPLLSDTGLTPRFITDALRRRAIAEFQGQADGYVINSPAFSKELGAWLLPNDTDSPLGMPGNNFGLTDEQAMRLHKGLLGEAALEPEDGLRFALAGKLGIEQSPLICVLTSKNDEPADWLRAGMALERSLLFFHARGFATAIHAGLVEVGLMNRMFAMTLGTRERILALFRVGKPKRAEDSARPHSPRLPLEAVLITPRSSR